MELCTWDWEIISAFFGGTATVFTGGVALYIFSKWNHQKATEVLAIEARDLSIRIIELKGQYIKVYNYFTSVDPENFCNGKERLKELIIQGIKIRNQIIYFCNLAEIDSAPWLYIINQMIITMKNSATNPQYVDRVDNNFHEDFDRTNIGIQKLLTELSEYILYRSKCPLKLKK